jgi:anthranilate 1,2-dioxygenase small subunit
MTVNMTMTDTSADEEAVRLSVEALLRRYIHCIDNGTFEEWPDFFTEDCRYQIIPRRTHERGQPVGFYYCDSRNMLKDRILCLRETAIYEPQFYRHMISGTHITALEEGICRAETNLMVVRTSQDGEMIVFAAGKYADEIDLTGATPKFKEKLVITDSARIDVLIAMPL